MKSLPNHTIQFLVCKLGHSRHIQPEESRYKMQITQQYSSKYIISLRLDLFTNVCVSLLKNVMPGAFPCQAAPPHPSLPPQACIS